MKKIAVIALLLVFVVLLGASATTTHAQENNVHFISALVWNSDGSRLAVARSHRVSCTNDFGTVYILDGMTGQVQTTLRGEICRIGGIAWSPDGSHLVMSGSYMDQLGELTQILIWDVASGAIEAQFRHGGQSSLGPVLWVNNRLFVAGPTENGIVGIREVSSGEVVGRLCCHMGNVLAMDLSADGLRVATVGHDNLLRIWDIATEQLVRAIPLDTDGTSAVAWSPDDRLLATGSRDNMARVWDARTGVLLGMAHGHTDSVTAVDWHPGGELLAGGSRDGTVRVWNVSDGRQLAIFDHGGPVYTLAWSPDGQRLAFGGEGRDVEIITFAAQTISLWD